MINLMANHPCTWMYSKWAMFRMLQFIDFKLPGSIHREPPKQIQANGSACGLETKAFGGSMNSHDSRPSLVSIYHTSLANCTYINYNQLSYCLETLSSPQLLIVWEIWMPIPPFMTGILSFAWRMATYLLPGDRQRTCSMPSFPNLSHLRSRRAWNKLTHRRQGLF